MSSFFFQGKTRWECAQNVDPGGEATSKSHYKTHKDDPGLKEAIKRRIGAEENATIIYERLPSGSEDFKMNIMNKLVKDDTGKLAMEDNIMVFYLHR